MADKTAEEKSAEAFRLAVRDALGDLTLQNIELRTMNLSLGEQVKALTPAPIAPPAPEGGT